MASKSAADSLVGFRVTSRAHEVNEDLAYIGSQMAWILDGATPINVQPQFDSRSDARWYVRFIDRELRAFQDSPHLSLGEILESAVLAARREILRKRPDWQYPPSAAIGMVRLVGKDLEYLRLADVTLAFGTQQASEVIRDTVGMEREQFLADLERTSGPDAVRKNVAARRRNDMNRQGGYWVLADKPDAVRRAEVGQIPTDETTRIVMMSDGLARTVDVFGMSTWDQLVHLNEAEAEALLSDMRTAEVNDKDRMLYPRLAVHDDATGVWLRTG